MSIASGMMNEKENEELEKSKSMTTTRYIDEDDEMCDSQRSRVKLEAGTYLHISPA